jgi:hypothetical protein
MRSPSSCDQVCEGRLQRRVVGCLGSILLAQYTRRSRIYVLGSAFRAGPFESSDKAGDVEKPAHCT